MPDTMLSAFRIDDARLRSRVAASIRHVHLTGGVGPAFDDTPPRLAIDGVRDEATAMLVDTGVVLAGMANAGSMRPPPIPDPVVCATRPDRQPTYGRSTRPRVRAPRGGTRD